MKLSIQVKVLAIVLLTVSKLVVAAPPPGKGPPSPPDPPTPDLGDLVKLYRNGDGVPILTTPNDPSCETATTGCCHQPLASASVECNDLEAQGQCVTTISEEIRVVSGIDPVTCAVDPACAPCIMETDFGRTNVIRSSPDVFDAQMEEVIRNLQLSQCVPTLDPAGRPVYYYENALEDGEYIDYAVDSPLQNLAIYRQLFLDDSFNDVIPQDQDPALTAARAIGAAVDKSGEVDVDMIQYGSRIFGLVDAETTLFPGRHCIWYRTEDLGALVNAEECFIDFSSFEYNRADNFGEVDGALPLPKYIPAGDSPSDGWFEYLELDSDEPTFAIGQGNILEKVFDGVEIFKTNIEAFMYAADDTRAVINYMHNWPVPGDYVTHPGCEENPDIAYDVYISALKVPTNMIAGATDREYSVTVGIDTINEVTDISLTLKGDVASTNKEFIHEDLFNLGEGGTYTLAGLVPEDLTAGAANKDTILWTATVDAIYDYNDSNDVMLASTLIRRSGGGSGGHATLKTQSLVMPNNGRLRKRPNKKKWNRKKLRRNRSKRNGQGRKPQD